MLERSYLQKALKFWWATGIAALVPVIYYQFSHGVTSPFMTYAFTVPLACGLLAGVCEEYSLFAAMLAALAYMIVRGVLDIAGSESWFLFFLPIIAGVLLVSSFVLQRMKQSYKPKF